MASLLVDTLENEVCSVSLRSRMTIGIQEGDPSSETLVISTRRSNRRGGLSVLLLRLHNSTWSIQIHFGHKRKLLRYLEFVYEVLII
jgi:hypothetical protein